MGQRKKGIKGETKQRNGHRQNHKTSPKTVNLKPDKSEASSSKNEPCLFPARTPWLVTLVTLAFRVYYVTDPRQWWVLHPDEIFQSMEVAHTELYGYGLRPYEFIPPARGDNLSHYLLREKTLGMNAMRSPLMPQFFMLVSAVVSLFGASVNPYLLWRVSHVIVSSSLPLAVSVYAYSVYKSRDIATVASLFTAISHHLTTFGTHSLINSFISPVLFLTISYTNCIIESETNACEKNTPTTADNSHSSGKIVTRLIKRLISKITPTVSEKSDSKSTEIDENSSSHSDVFTSLAPTQNSHTATMEHQEEITRDRLGSRSSRTSDPGYHSNSSSNGDADDESIENDHRELHRCDSVLEESEGSLNKRTDHYDPYYQRDLTLCFFTGFLLVIVMYTRPDSAIFVAILLLGHHRWSMTLALLGRKRVLVHILGGVVGLMLAIGNDVYFYNCFVISPLNWMKFNVFSQISSELFGTSGQLFYIQGIFLHSCGMMVLSFMFVSATLSCLAKSAFDLFVYIQNAFSLHDSKSDVFQIYSNDLVKIFNHWCTKVHIFCILVMILIYSGTGHKEVRFLHDTVVLFFVSVSTFIVSALSSIKFLNGSKKFILILSLLVFAHNQFQVFTSTEGDIAENTSSVSSPISADNNQCLHYISLQSDVSGLFLERHIQDTASFSILHKNVPILFYLGMEFYEFDNTSLVSFPRFCFTNKNCSVSFFTLNSISDIIHQKNPKYLIKRLVDSTSYNYAVVNSNKDFFYPAFTKVFSTKTTSVWRRTYNKGSEDDLKIMGRSILEGGVNGTVLEYEAEVLKQLGNYRLAVERFRSALEQGHIKVTVYASMAYCLHRMDNDKEMDKVLNKCFKVFPRKDCMDGDRARVLSLDNSLT